MDDSSDSKPSASTFRKLNVVSDPSGAKIVPFKSGRMFYKEYTLGFELDKKNKDKSDMASSSTFKRALEGFTSTKTLRFSRCKGSMAKCDICNNAERVLASQSNLRQAHRDMIHEYVKIHHEQQEAERLFAEIQKVKSYKTKDGEGDPIFAWFLVDAMGTFATESPKNGTKGATGKEWAHCPKFETRLIAVEVVCGPVVAVFHYYTDATVGHGANTLIEVIRRAFKDLARILAEQGLKFPRMIKLQFDNSGEQKVGH
jgi:hypothetical protein